jgi:hypothetical protein
MSVLSLRCYRCGTEYGYIGTTPHPGRCPACESPCVPPAGELTVVDSSCWQSANGLSKVRVRAVDHQDRPFDFEVAGHDSRGRLVALTVDEVSVVPRFDDARSHLPSVITDEIADFGITELEAPFPQS